MAHKGRKQGYWPIRHFEEKYLAKMTADCLAKKRKTLETGLSIVAEGKDAYALLAKTKRQMLTGRHLLGKKKGCPAY